MPVYVGLGALKSSVALRSLGVAPTIGEKGVAVKVGETGASHLTPLQAPVWFYFLDNMPRIETFK